MESCNQLWHGGHIYTAEGGGPSWGVSAVPSATGVFPEPMSIRDLSQRKNLVDDYFYLT